MDALATLRSRVEGTVTGPDDEGYEDARAIWNAMIDRRPVALVRAARVGDIAPTIAAARELGLGLAIRGGGHNVAGNGTVEGGIVLDLGGLTDVVVDPITREVRVSPGATLGHLDRATEPFGLAVPVGVVSGTGVAGLTLGGGVGWLTHAHGLTVDNLLAVDVVTASGETVRATESENPELFWGVRGGGGNFGVVSSFTFRAHPLGPDVLAGTFVSRPEHWEAALRGLDDVVTRRHPGPADGHRDVHDSAPEFELGPDPVMLIGLRLGLGGAHGGRTRRRWPPGGDQTGCRGHRRRRHGAPGSPPRTACSRRASGPTGRTRHSTGWTRPPSRSSSGAGASRPGMGRASTSISWKAPSAGSPRTRRHSRAGRHATGSTSTATGPTPATTKPGPPS